MAFAQDDVVEQRVFHARATTATVWAVERG